METLVPSTLPFQFPATNRCWNSALEVKRLYVPKLLHSLVLNFYSVLGRDRARAIDILYYECQTAKKTLINNAILKLTESGHPKSTV